MVMISSLLIANRGEIACRIIRTARRLGIRTVAVYSDADAGALHVRMADEAVAIGPAAARESYLVGDKIIAAAKATGAEAIHPGYGFLSENAEFAAAVIEAGLVWVGPSPASITAMGLKDAAKALMEAAGVPVTPGYMGEQQEADFLAAQAEAIGWPVLIKAVAGGGGKGMRLVERAEDFADALASCQREAEKSFGNAHVLIEKFITCPRHIEVQVFGDSHGNVVHLFERDCSLQRRHQKVIEEAPAPGMDAATREALCAAAVRAAKAVDYVGAGTIEFIADASQGLSADRIWFMEMNTRLQVEHPVTEAITGTDLVEWQLRVASGEPVPLRQDELAIKGHAIEARLYAEDTARGFLPSIGPLTRLALPADMGRVDTGVTEGDSVSPHYDPMIAKLIHHADTRGQAIAGLGAMAAATQVWPVKTNAGFLAKALADEDFAEGRVDTGLIARKGDDWVPEAVPSQDALEAVAQAVLAPRATGAWGQAGLRLNQPAASLVVRLAGEEGMHEVVLSESTAPSIPLIRRPDGWLVSEAGQTFHLSPWRPASSEGAGGSGAIHAPMPGMVIAVDVAVGDKVVKGQKLLVLEAMKMEQALVAPFDGIVREVVASVGQQIAADVLLVRIEEED
jgi:3-methylcrotonyl-CoA carboxylase alpha subunit